MSTWWQHVCIWRLFLIVIYPRGSPGAPGVWFHPWTPGGENSKRGWLPYLCLILLSISHLRTLLNRYAHSIRGPKPSYVASNDHWMEAACTNTTIRVAMTLLNVMARLLLLCIVLRVCLDAISAAGSTPSDSSHVGGRHRLSRSSRLRDHLSPWEADLGNAGKLVAGDADDATGRCHGSTERWVPVRLLQRWPAAVWRATTSQSCQTQPWPTTTRPEKTRQQSLLIVLGWYWANGATLSQTNQRPNIAVRFSYLVYCLVTVTRITVVQCCIFSMIRGQENSTVVY